MSDNLVLHISHEVSLPVPDEDIPAALKLVIEEGEKIKELLATKAITGGREIRLPLNYGPGGRKKFEGIICREP